MSAGPVLTSQASDRYVQLAFASYQPMDNYISEYLVTANANGLSASAPVITSPKGDGLPEFLLRLSDDFRGWTGARSWRSLDSQLRIDATWRSGGHVGLTFHLRPSVYDKWSVSVEITLEAGEELRRLGEDFAAFMS